MPGGVASRRQAELVGQRLEPGDEIAEFGDAAGPGGERLGGEVFFGIDRHATLPSLFGPDAAFDGHRFAGRLRNS